MTTPSEYKSITDCFPYSNASLEDSPFPKQFPFSAMVVRVYTEVKDFILSCVKFSEDLNLSQVIFSFPSNWLINIGEASC